MAYVEIVKRDWKANVVEAFKCAYSMLALLGLFFLRMKYMPMDMPNSDEVLLLAIVVPTLLIAIISFIGAITITDYYTERIEVKGLMLKGGVGK